MIGWMDGRIGLYVDTLTNIAMKRIHDPTLAFLFHGARVMMVNFSEAGHHSEAEGEGL